MTETTSAYKLIPMKCTIYTLSNTIQHYPWGSKKSIPDLLGIEADGRPYAELWMGDHQRGPSMVSVEDSEKPVELGKLFDKDPKWFLGDISLRRFGPALPFLFKVLAAAEPLSIQAHPDKRQAEEGFDREEAADIPLNAPYRNYRDRNHKPEIIAALTPFTAMCGFRKREDIQNRFTEIGGSVVKDILLPSLRKTDEGEALSAFFAALLGLEKNRKSSFIESLREWEKGKKNRDEETELVSRFLKLHPDDPAVSAPLYLNVVRLAPGEALYQPAGLLHAYVDGTGIELMANSDNVLRGGLTGKYMDIAEMQSVLQFSSYEPDLIRSEPDEDGLEWYLTPAQEFVLKKFPGGRAALPEGVPSVILVTSGTIQIDSGCGVKEFRKGESVFVPAACAIDLAGEGQAYIASLPVREVI